MKKVFFIIIGSFLVIAISVGVVLLTRDESIIEKEINYEKTEVLYDCEEGQLEVVFYINEKDSYIEIKLSDNKIIIGYQDISESGIIYQSKNEVFTFSTKGENAFLEENEEIIYNNCTKVDFYKNRDNLEREINEFNFFQYGNLIINNPGMKEREWYLSYEEEGSPALEKIISFNKEQVNCFAEEDICPRFFAKDNSLQGLRVEILGEEKEGEVNLFEIKFLEY